MISQNVFTLLPNIFEGLIGTDVGSNRYQFAVQGVTVNVVNNLGTFFTSLVFLMGVLCLFAGITFVVVKCRKGQRYKWMDRTQEYLGLELGYSVIESNNQNIILGILIGLTEGMNLPQRTVSKVFLFIFLVLLLLFMLGMYGFIIFTIRKHLKDQKATTTSAPELVLEDLKAIDNNPTAFPENRSTGQMTVKRSLVKRKQTSGPSTDNKKFRFQPQAPKISSEAAGVNASESKRSKFAFWYEDIVENGNVFQSYFTVVKLLKDMIFAHAVYFLYYYPLMLMIVLLCLQAPLIFCAFKYRPFKKVENNKLLIIMEVLYFLLQTLFLILVVIGKSLEYMSIYYGIGFPLIGCVLLLFASSMYYALKSSFRLIKERWCKSKEQEQLPESRIKSPDLSAKGTDKQFMQNRTRLTSLQKKNSSVSQINSQSPIRGESPGSSAHLKLISPRAQISGFSKETLKLKLQVPQSAAH